MKLSTYLADNGISYSAFARAVGAPYPRTIERYAKGQRTPRPAMMARIREVTGGQVTAEDFYV
jgi:hypothetical protein